MPKNGQTSQDLVTGYMIQEYLEKYAIDHDLHRRIKFDSWVERAERCPRGWRLQLAGEGDAFETEKLLVATGITSVPNMPKFTTISSSIPIIHSKELGASVPALESNNIHHVVVIGASKSAYDTVYLLLKMGKKITWLIRPNGTGPMPVLPAEMLGCNSIAVGSTRLMSHLSPSILNIKGPIYSFFQRSIPGKFITSRFWDMLTYLSNWQAGYSYGGNISALKPEDEKR